MPSTIVRDNGEDFAFDVELYFDPGRDFDVTKHPVEQGAQATDHHQLRTEVLTITGTISDTPMPTATFEPAATNRPQLARAWLGALEGEFVDIVHSELGVWRNCLLLRDRSPMGRMRGTTITVSFEQVQVARREYSRLPPIQMRPKNAVGDQQPDDKAVDIDEEAADNQAAPALQRRRSMALRLATGGSSS